ncbi:hypothetical protein SDC9_150761 [bioreactor metagenome]|uniref:Uncharacterized protein n=1 Tax=bioreactor metagenome TaxID=1076179 RepID=A0A645ENE7_9ZZZZ
MRQISANEGVETQNVVPERANDAKASLKLAICALSMLHKVPPVLNDMYKSMTDKSKENGA